MEEGSSAQSYIEQFEDIVAEATILDMDIIKTPEQLALQFLAGLPKSLENFSDIISLNSQESGKELTPKSVTTALLSHVRTKSSKLDNVPEEDTAMNVDKSKAACHHCGKKGHFKSECYDLVGKPKGQGGRKGQGSQRGGGSKKKEEANKAGRSGRDWGLATVATGNVEEEAFSVDDGAWIADSRCSNHICNDRSALHDFKPHSTTVKVADNKVVGTEGIGNLIVTTTVNGVTQTFQIFNRLPSTHSEEKLLTRPTTRKNLPSIVYGPSAQSRTSTIPTTRTSVKDDQVSPTWIRGGSREKGKSTSEDRHQRSSSHETSSSTRSCIAAR